MNAQFNIDSMARNEMEKTKLLKYVTKGNATMDMLRCNCLTGNIKQSEIKGR